MENITFEEISDRSGLLMDVDPDHTYQISYPFFVNYFDQLDQIEMENLIIGANCIYGWMPTILNYKDTTFEEALEILNQVKNGDMIDDDQIIMLKNLINNSFVGVSKLLHFVNPSNYAIWDSKVYKFLINHRHVADANRIENFTPYLDLCRRLAEDRRFDQVQPEFENHLGYEVSPMRKVELIMFMNSDLPLE